MGLGFSSTWVLPVIGEGKSKPPIAAYYTMGNVSIKSAGIPFDKKLPPYDAPVVLLAKMAVDLNFQKK